MSADGPNELTGPYSRLSQREAWLTPIQHGGADSVVSPAQSQALLAALKERGVPAELVIYPGVGHDFTRNGQPDPAVNQEALAKIGAFLAGIFPPGPVGVKTAQQRGPVY